MYPKDSATVLWKLEVIIGLANIIMVMKQQSAYDVCMYILLMRW